MLCYGSVIWGLSKLWKYQKDNLRYLLRHSLLAMAPMRRNTPQASLEIIFNQMPLEMQIQKHGLLGYLRVRKIIGTSWPGVGLKGKIGVMKQWSNLARKLKVIELQEECIPLTHWWKVTHTVGQPHYEDLDNLKVFIAHRYNYKSLIVGTHVDIYVGKSIKADLQKSMSYRQLLSEKVSDPI